MTMKLMYITNNPKIAEYADQAGVDWIFIDLEKLGKEERQGHIDSVKSNHEIADIKKVKEKVKNSKILVRINPINANSKEEIEDVIGNGAEIIMLPFFKTLVEVEKFLGYVAGRAETILLLETPEAVEIIDNILELQGIDYIHVGLNDLHLGYKMKFMFELLADKTVERLCEKINNAGIPYGFGGIAKLGEGDLPAELILAEHYRLKSNMVILARSFCNVSNLRDISDAKPIFIDGLKEIRNYEKYLSNQDDAFFTDNFDQILEIVNKITKREG